MYTLPTHVRFNATFHIHINCNKINENIMNVYAINIRYISWVKNYSFSIYTQVSFFSSAC